VPEPGLALSSPTPQPSPSTIARCLGDQNGTNDVCCSGSTCISALGAENQAAFAQWFDLSPNEGVLFQGTGWKPGTTVQIFFDSEFIGTCTPNSSGSFNNGGDTSNNTTCTNLPFCLNGWENINPAFCGIVPLQVSRRGNPDFFNDYGFQIPGFDSADPSTLCSSLVRAIQGPLEVDAEVAGNSSITAMVLFTVVPSGGASICTDGTNPVVGSVICALLKGTNPGAALITAPSGAGGAWVGFNSGIPNAQDGTSQILGIVSVDSGHLYLGVGNQIVKVPALAGGPSSASACDCTLPNVAQVPPGVQKGSLSLSGFECSKGDLTIDGDLTLNIGVLCVQGNLIINGSVNGVGSIDALKTMTITGTVGLSSDDVNGLISGGDMLLCGNTTPCVEPASATPTPTAKPTPVPTASPTAVTLTPTPVPSASPSAAPTHTPAPTPTPSTPFISSVPAAILVGGSFTITGTDFTAGSVVNFFVSTSAGPVNAGPFTPTARSLPTQLTVNVPATTPLGEGFVAVEVVNTDTGFKSSNLAAALLQGSAAAGIPTITTINGVGLAATSSNPSFAIDNVQTVVVPGSLVTLGGSGFDTVNGVAVDLFCACTGGKVGPFFINPGAGLTSTRISFTLPAAGPNVPVTGPGSFVVSNATASRSYAVKSNAVSAPIGQGISVTSVTQSGTTITVNGTGFSDLTVINFFNTQGGGVVNLGGLNSRGAPAISLTLANPDQFTFTSPAGAVSGASYVQALNPPFVPFTSSGNDPGGAFTLK
jgi:hypothetical protein